MCALQALATLAADPLASLVNTAYIGRFGEAIGSHGTSIAALPGTCGHEKDACMQGAHSSQQWAWGCLSSAL